MLGGDQTAWSPLGFAAAIRAPVLLVYGADDALVPLSQGRRMHAALGAHSTLLTLRAGGEPFVHGTVTAKGMRRVARREARLLHGAA